MIRIWNTFLHLHVDLELHNYREQSWSTMKSRLGGYKRKVAGLKFQKQTICLLARLIGLQIMLLADDFMGNRDSCEDFHTNVIDMTLVRLKANV